MHCAHLNLLTNPPRWHEKDGFTGNQKGRYKAEVSTKLRSKDHVTRRVMKPTKVKTTEEEQN